MLTRVIEPVTGTLAAQGSGGSAQGAPPPGAGIGEAVYERVLALVTRWMRDGARSCRRCTVGPA